MEITYNSQNFPRRFGAKFQGTNQLQFTVQELMWSAITVGRANFIDVLSNGTYSEYELLYRASILVANIAQNGTTLVKSSAYEHLDPSEKSAVSYFLGLTFTKLLSAKLLNIPWLLHIDVYRDQFSRNGQAFGFGSSRSRPDLIGLDNKRGWTIMESKGRTNTMEARLLESAKNQTKNLRRIGSEVPRLRVAVITHFTKGQLMVDWSDPAGYNDDYFDIKTDTEEFLANYYKVIFNILESNYKNSKEFGGFVTYTFDAINLTIGLDKKVFDAYRTQSLKEIQLTRIFNFEEFSSIAEQVFFVGSDGVLVGLGSNWRELIRTNKKFNE
ncbi:MAG: hypothetical protein ACOYK3_06175 [Flavobacterium sp.]